MPIILAFWVALGAIGVDMVKVYEQPKTVGLFSHSCKGIEIMVVPVCHKVFPKGVK